MNTRILPPFAVDLVHSLYNNPVYIDEIAAVEFPQILTAQFRTADGPNTKRKLEALDGWARRNYLEKEGE
jgi:hypothetical protein